MTMRWAVSALFFVNGLLVGSWAPKIPVLMERLGITEASAGVIVLGLWLTGVYLWLLPIRARAEKRSRGRQAD